MAIQIQIRRDTSTNWTNNDPTLAQGELGYETDTGKTKIGDGTTIWSLLDYLTGDYLSLDNTTPFIPDNPYEPATKSYVDGLAGSVFWENISAATTANVDLTSELEEGDIIDGYTLTAGERVAVINQTNAEENGIYVVPVSGTASRASDADTESELNNRKFIALNGTANSNILFFVTSNITTLGTDAITFAQIITGEYSAGTYLTLSGGVFDLDVSKDYSWTGNHNFVNSPTVPTPSNNLEAVNKEYVDNNSAGISQSTAIAYAVAL